MRHCPRGMVQAGANFLVLPEPGAVPGTKSALREVKREVKTVPLSLRMSSLAPLFFQEGTADCRGLQVASSMGV